MRFVLNELEISRKLPEMIPIRINRQKMMQTCCFKDSAINVIDSTVDMIVYSCLFGTSFLKIGFAKAKLNTETKIVKNYFVTFQKYVTFGLVTVKSTVQLNSLFLTFGV